MTIPYVVYQEHVINRTVWELDNVCYKRKCVICEQAHKQWGI